MPSMKLQLTQHQRDAVAQKAQVFRLENGGRTRITAQVAEESARVDWDDLTTQAKSYLRQNVDAVVRALEANGFEIRRIEASETAGAGA